MPLSLGLRAQMRSYACSPQPPLMRCRFVCRCKEARFFAEFYPLRRLAHT